MFIKYSTEQRLESFMKKGEMYFNPAQKYREIEEHYKLKGQGDKNDSGLHSIANTAFIMSPDGKVTVAHDVENSILMGPAKNTPVFCLKRADNEYISKSYRLELRKQFPEYTHALIIDDEKNYLENIRYSMRNKAFAHKVFYQDNYCLDFLSFLYSGDSDILFYPPKKKKQNYYAHMMATNNNGEKLQEIFIDDSNYYKTMFRKDTFFQSQQEYRIVLPREHITKGKIFIIHPFHARILPIDDLVKE